MVDFHTHSNASDGTFTPAQVARAAKAAGLSSCALTDHDTVSGVDEFLAECERAGIEGVPGVELSVRAPFEMHMVGLYIDYKDEAFLKKLYRLEHAREIRNLAMIERCREHGFELTAEDLLENGALSIESAGRPHFAKAFIKRGYARTTKEVFDKYLGFGKCCYVERKRFSPAETIRMIKDAGGIAVLAHPVQITKDQEQLAALLAELKEYGLDAAECYYSDNSAEFTAMIRGLCARLNLMESGGSDFHGANKPDIEIGRGRGTLYVPEGVCGRQSQ